MCICEIGAMLYSFFFQAEDGIRDYKVTGVQTCALPICRLTVVAITGTNGKTTTSLLVEALLGAGGRPTGVIGTIQYRVGEQTETASQTTPEALELQSLLSRMA